MIYCALFEPDIPQNAGTVMRMGACLGVPIHIIHPSGFALTDRNFRRAGMDYRDRAELREHGDWSAFATWCRAAKLPIAALSTRGPVRLHDHLFQPDEVILLGRESAGLPAFVLSAANAVLRIPMRDGNRSLNVAAAAAIAVAEALRQTGQLP